MTKKQKQSFVVRSIISFPLMVMMGIPFPIAILLVAVEYFGEKWLLKKGLNVPFM